MKHHLEVGVALSLARTSIIFFFALKQRSEKLLLVLFSFKRADSDEGGNSCNVIKHLAAGMGNMLVRLTAEGGGLSTPSRRFLLPSFRSQVSLSLSVLCDL